MRYRVENRDVVIRNEINIELDYFAAKGVLPRRTDGHQMTGSEIVMCNIFIHLQYMFLEQEVDQGWTFSLGGGRWLADSLSVCYLPPLCSLLSWSRWRDLDFVPNG